MFKKKGMKDAGISIAAGVGIGIAVSLIVTILGAMLTAWMVSAEKIGESSMGIVSKLLHILAAIFGAGTASALVKKLRLQTCLLTGLGYYLVLLGITALLFGGQYGNLGFTALMIAIGCLATACLPMKKGMHFKKQKHAYR